MHFHIFLYPLCILYVLCFGTTKLNFLSITPHVVLMHPNFYAFFKKHFPSIIPHVAFMHLNFYASSIHLPCIILQVVLMHSSPYAFLIHFLSIISMHSSFYAFPYTFASPMHPLCIVLRPHWTLTKTTMTKEKWFHLFETALWGIGGQRELPLLH